MSRLILVLILACFTISALLGQSGTGRTGNTSTAPQINVSPGSSINKNTKTGTANSAEHSGDRNTNTSTSQNRPSSANNTYGNSKIKTSVQDRSTRPSKEKVNRPATYAPPTNNTATTAKGWNSTVQNATSLNSTEKGTVNWMTLEQAMERCKTEKRKIFVDMYTDWCGWCKHMDSTTFVNPIIARYLNEHYYPVKFNAEQEQDIVFKDKTYHFKKNGTRGYHELAAFWLNNRLSFPTVVFLDENQQLIQPVPGYQDATKLDAILNYFGSDSHKKTPWESYEKNFSNRK